MFLGEFEHSIDQKGRIAVPARFREYLSSILVLARGLDRCIDAYPPDAWEEHSAKLAALSRNHGDARRLNRNAFSSAFRIEIDSQGRVLVPQPLRDYASIADNAIIVGMNETFEIWSPDLYSAERTAMIDSAAQLAERLEL